MATFPPALPDLLTPDAALQTALNTAIASAVSQFPNLGNPLRTPISIAAINENVSPPTFGYAGFKDRDMFFSASLLKAAAMFAAFRLRQRANKFAATSGEPTDAAMFASMSSAFDDDIANAVQILSTAPPVITREMKIPKYRTIFDATPLASGGFDVKFKQTFLTDMRKMVVESHTASSSRVIQALGYGWINGLLASSGLFNPTTKKGIWLAGTFTGAFPAVRVPSVNDGPSAQATTCFDMANMIALIFEKAKIDDPNIDGICDEMNGLLRDATGFDPTWLVKRNPGEVGLSSDFRATHTKIGVGNLNVGMVSVLSEAIILGHIPSVKRFVVVWQDTPATTANKNGLVFLFERAIKNFLGIP